MTQEIRFEEPASPIPRKAERIEFMEELKKTPGQWALLGTTGTVKSGSSLAWMIRHARGNMSEFSPAGAFEAESRTLLGEHRIYVKYTGEGQA